MVVPIREKGLVGVDFDDVRGYKNRVEAYLEFA